MALSPKLASLSSSSPPIIFNMLLTPKNLTRTIVFITLEALPSFGASASTTPLEISFSNGGRSSFSAQYDKTSLSFKDQMGQKNLKIKSCNQKIVKDFWKSLQEHTEKIQIVKVGKTAPKLQAAMLKVDKVEFPILETDPSLRFFTDVPSQINVVFIESLRRCKKK